MPRLGVVGAHVAHLGVSAAMLPDSRMGQLALLTVCIAAMQGFAGVRHAWLALAVTVHEALARQAQACCTRAACTNALLGLATPCQYCMPVACVHCLAVTCGQHLVAGSSNGWVALATSQAGRVPLV